MIRLVLLIMSILFMVSGLIVGLSSLTQLNNQVPPHNVAMLRLWMSPSRLRSYFVGSGYRRMVTGGQLMGAGALIYLSSLLLK